MMFSFDSMNDAYHGLLTSAMKRPVVEARGLKFQEIAAAQVMIMDARKRLVTIPQRKLSDAFRYSELAWYAAGDDTLDWIRTFAPSYGKYSDYGKYLFGAYGPRMEGQIERSIELLRADPGSRQAVVMIRDRQDIYVVTKDQPCTMCLQFLVRHDKVNLIATMRSNDLWYGFPYDAAQFMTIQAVVASTLELPVGWYIHQAGSLHLYDSSIRRAIEVIEASGYDSSFDCAIEETWEEFAADAARAMHIINNAKEVDDPVKFKVNEAISAMTGNYWKHATTVMYLELLKRREEEGI